MVNHKPPNGLSYTQHVDVGSLLEFKLGLLRVELEFGLRDSKACGLEIVLRVTPWDLR